jgi:hypothetical protein
VAKLLFDTGPLVALVFKDEDRHEECAQFLKGFRGRFVSTEAILTEALYLLGNSFANQERCFDFIFQTVQLIPASTTSLLRCLSLMEKYQDVPMDYADATLVALAEEMQLGGIFTLDRRGFETYRWGRNRAFKVYP